MTQTIGRHIRIRSHVDFIFILTQIPISKKKNVSINSNQNSIKALRGICDVKLKKKKK